MGLRRYTIGGLAFAVLTLGLLAGCAGNKQEAPRSMAVPVTVATAVQKDVPLTLNAIATVEPFISVGVKPQTTGEITGVNFREGQDVQKGQVLFALDRRPLEADLRRLEATLAKDEATAKNDRVTADRYTALVKQGVIAKQQADVAEATANASEALVKADRAAVENARVQLVYATIKAPISGRTGNLMVQLGNVVKANPDNPLVTINQISPIYVTFTIPEQFLGEVKRYMAKGKLTVQAALPNDPAPATGVLTFVDNTVDPKTGTIKLKGTFQNKDRRLWPGQFVNASLTLSMQPNAILVPTQALQAGQQGQFLFVVNPADKTVQLRQVQVTRTMGDQSIIASGVKAGEIVVTDGQVRLVAGAKVEVRNGSAPANAGTPASQDNNKQQEARKQD